MARTNGTFVYVATYPDETAAREDYQVVKGCTILDPGQAGLIVVGESRVAGAIQDSVTRAQKQTAEELDVDPHDIDQALRRTVGEM